MPLNFISTAIKLELNIVKSMKVIPAVITLISKLQKCLCILLTFIKHELGIVKGMKAIPEGIINDYTENVKESLQTLSLFSDKNRKFKYNLEKKTKEIQDQLGMPISTKKKI